MSYAKSRLSTNPVPQRVVALFFLCILFLAVPQIRAQSPDKSSDAVTFDFDAVDIRSFIKIVSELTGRNYVVDPAVTGKITVTSPQPVPLDAVDDVFQSVLNVYGFVAVSQNDIVTIVPSVRAKEGGELAKAGVRFESDAYVTRIFRLQRADVNELRSVVSPLLSRAGHVTSHPGSRTLIITDLAGNVDRLEGILRSIDGSGPELVQRTMTLQEADAEAVATAVTALYAAQPPLSGIRPVIIAESRTNTLLIHAATSDIPAVKKLIKGLDVPRTDQRSTLKVIRLRFADATSVAAILNSQWTAGNRDGNSSPHATRGSRSAPGSVSVTADTYSNALIVSASPDVIRMVEDVIRDLDIPRRQILVEAMIVEMSSDLTRELGVEWRLTDAIDEDGTTAIGGTTFPANGGGSPLQDTAANPLGLPPGLAFGIVDGTITWGGTTIANIAGLARAMEGTSGVNVLSTPHLLALDNEEAEIIVGEERPFLKSSQTTDTNAVIRTYEFKDTGLTLRVTPRTTDDEQVILKIFQEINTFVAESDIGAVTTSKRQARTTIRVGNGQMVAIGGLLKENRSDLTSAVPCLGAIPVLGHLFKSVRTSSDKTNLLIFMTPTIIPDLDSLDTAGRKYRDRLDTMPTPTPAIDIPMP